MELCGPPWPAAWEGGRPARAGPKARNDAPVESVRLRPSWPEEFARPPGVSPELSSSRVVSHVPAARITARALTRWRAPVLRSTYSTPAARPALAIPTLRTIASVTVGSLLDSGCAAGWGKGG